MPKVRQSLPLSDPRLWVTTAVSAVLLMACANPEAGSPHPADALDYPVSVTADPSGEYVWVTSGNFDLSWRGGAVIAIDLATHRFVSDRERTDEGLPEWLRSEDSRAPSTSLSETARRSAHTY